MDSRSQHLCIRPREIPPADILTKIQDYHVTSLCAPPTIFRFLIHEDLTKYDLFIAVLHHCRRSVEPRRIDTFKKLTGISLMEGFGQTETTAHRSHHAVDATQTGQHGIAQSPIRRRPDRP